ncbi:hypothetical protein DS745_22970 [Anaerobacillus alkaliphilus]|uniref:Uncharacterized protein n=1 Tax=Anaerobacillus alkaliphilus TaxID=1548597 RepID=A0A4V1LFV1_9BACI|nr:hypothetical protein [Anaerobacillus alkaliphilus]RXI96569.1 hypothetical protein DS745_22970 [Anaerobacillus alkaliphilus]
MGKKRSGHYCFVCGRYRANEKFSGKGHRQHICKDCKSKGKHKDIPNLATPSGRILKHLKVKLVVTTEFASYLFFEINGAVYATYDFDDVTDETFKYIYKYNKKELLFSELSDDLPYKKVDIVETLFIKSEHKYEISIDIDEFGCFYKDDLDYEPTEKQMKYIRLVPAINTATINRIFGCFEQDTINIMIVDTD